MCAIRWLCQNNACAAVAAVCVLFVTLSKHRHLFSHVHTLTDTHQTRRDGQMSRASVSGFGDRGNLNIAGLNPGRVKSMTYACRFLARCSALLGEGKGWLAQCQENVTEWDMVLAAGSASGAALESPHEHTLSLVGT